MIESGTIQGGLSSTDVSRARSTGVGWTVAPTMARITRTGSPSANSTARAAGTFTSTRAAASMRGSERQRSRFQRICRARSAGETLSAARVSLPTEPSTGRPCAVWNCDTASGERLIEGRGIFGFRSRIEITFGDQPVAQILDDVAVIAELDGDRREQRMPRFRIERRIAAQRLAQPLIARLMRRQRREYVVDIAVHRGVEHLAGIESRRIDAPIGLEILGIDPATRQRRGIAQERIGQQQLALRRLRRL